MKRNNKLGFTLVELLAVIVILAIILVIAVPQIMNVIKDTTKASLESSAKMVAAQVENQHTVAQTLGKEFGDSGSCMQDWAGLNDVDYASCTYEVVDGTAKVTIEGKGKFNGLSVCDGTRNSATVIEGSCGITCKDNEVLLEGVCVKATNVACFNFDSSTGTIRHYYLHEDNDESKSSCPLDVIIPNKINNVAVTKIGVGAFTDCTSGECDGYLDGLGITSVIIPSNITEIGAHSFRYNEIVSVKLPISVTTIGKGAFDDNQISGALDLSNLNNLSVVSGFASNQITSIKLPTSVTTIGNSAFDNNQISGVLDLSNLTNLTIIGEEAFSYNEITSVKLPTSVTSIDGFDNNQITSVKLPTSVTNISGFSNNKISGVLDLSNLINLKTIGANAFIWNEITSVKLPISVTAIDSEAFRVTNNQYSKSNPNLTTIINPSGKSFDWNSITTQGTSDGCTFTTGTCGSITIKAS